MSCQYCGDKGIIRMKFHSGEQDQFALCLCAAGLAWRCDTNAGRQTHPLWHVWAAREQVAHDRIGLIEEWNDEAELRALFPFYRSEPDAAALPDEDVLLAAGRQRRGKL